MASATFVEFSTDSLIAVPISRTISLASSSISILVGMLRQSSKISNCQLPIANLLVVVQFRVQAALHEKWHTRSSLCNLCVLCASVVHYCSEKTTTETQSTQRLHREEAEQRLFVQSWFDLDAADDFGPLSAGVLRDDMVAFDHAVEGLPIDAQNARR